MRAIDVVVNGRLHWRAGMPDASILTPVLHAGVADELPVSLEVSGMCDLERGRAAHVYWCESFALAEGDTVLFRFIDAQNVTPPAKIKPTDSFEYLAEQQEFAQRLKNFIPDREPAERRHPSISFEYRLNNTPPAIATFVGAEEHMVCSLSWVKQRPDQCRVSVRTFGDKSKPEHSPATEWLQASLALSDELSVRIAA